MSCGIFVTFVTSAERYFNNFNGADLKRIHEYAIFCEKNIFKSEVTNIETCIYSETQKNKCAAFNLPSIAVPLVDSRQTKNVEAQKQLTAEVMNMLPDITTSVLNNIDINNESGLRCIRRNLTMFSILMNSVPK